MYQFAILFSFSCLFLSCMNADSLEIPRNYKKKEHESFLDSKNKCVEDLVRLLPLKPPLDHLMTIAGAWRMRQARDAKVEDAHYFGKLRDMDIVSDFHLAGGSYMQEKIDLILKNGQWVESFEDVDCPGAPIRRFVINANLQGEEFVLTQVLYFHGDYPTWGYVIPRIFRTPHLKYTWWHTSAENAKRIVALLENVYQDICDEKDKEKVLSKVAEFHWWFSQATPFMRGSAAIAEAICQSLLTYKGLELEKVPYLMIDIEVLCEPSVEEFIRVYPSFYREKRKI